MEEGCMKYVATFVITFVLTLALLLVCDDATAHNRPYTKHNVEHAIALGFCGDVDLPACGVGQQATIISTRCEAKSLSPWAGFGKHDYWGIFQVSSHWRETVPGFAFNIWSQAKHAARVHRLVGWSHWECAYRMGVL
jgi:hypothetical protein